MRTIQVNLYKFEELSEEAKQKAIENLYDINAYYGWWECTYDDAKRIGLKITGFYLDRNKHATGEFLLSANEVAQNILNEHGEQCETYKTASAFLENHAPLFAEYMDINNEHYLYNVLEQELIDLENDFLNSLLEDYSIILQKEYEYLVSEEAIIETIELNQYEFYKNGELA